MWFNTTSHKISPHIQYSTAPHSPCITHPKKAEKSNHLVPKEDVWRGEIVRRGGEGWGGWGLILRAYCYPMYYCTVHLISEMPLNGKCLEPLMTEMRVTFDSMIIIPSHPIRSIHCSIHLLSLISKHQTTSSLFIFFPSHFHLFAQEGSTWSLPSKGVFFFLF